MTLLAGLFPDYTMLNDSWMFDGTAMRWVELNLAPGTCIAVRTQFPH